MGQINSRQVSISRSDPSRTWTTLDEYLNRKRIIRMSWNESQTLLMSAPSQFKLIDSTTHIPSGLLGVLTSTPPTTLTTNDSVIAAKLPGSVGAASVISYSDSLDNILNIVYLRYSDNHSEIKIEINGINRTVFGLIQCDNTTVEGDPIGLYGFENTQISFVYIDENNSLQLATVNDVYNIDFTINKLFIEGHQPDIIFEETEVQQTFEVGSYQGTWE